MAGIARPFPPPALSAITVDDARSVACKSGVAEFISRNRIASTAVDTGLLLGLAENKEQSIYIKMAAGLYGYGYGNGYSDGDGNGYSDGDGYGYSDGDGNGYGDGDGYGYSDSDGNGNGYGYGYGDGYGYGSE